MRGPPRLARWLLRRVLPAAEHDFVLGDLEEAFERRRVELGYSKAVWWYWSEVMRSCWPLLSYPGRWRGLTMVGLKQDLRGAFRIFRRSPGFAAVVVVTLGIGVGGAAAVYSVVRGILLTPMPFEEPERVVMLWGQTPEYPRTPLTVGDHNALANDVRAFERVAAQWSNNALILGEGDAEQVGVGWVTHQYFPLLGIHPQLGRTLAEDDVRAVLLSHALWVRRYGSDPAVVGRSIDLSGESFEIAGILPPDRNPNLTTFGGARATHQVWRLQPPEWTQGDDRSVGWIRSTARLGDGVTLAQAQAEVDALFETINATITDRDGGTDLRINLIPVKADLVGGIEHTLWVLLIAVCGVLLIAASNVAHLVLARGEARGGEIAVRTALGGSRARVARQLLVESGVLAAAGGLTGLVLAYIGVPALVALAPSTLPRLDLVQVDWGVFLFALGATGFSGVVFALVPALRGSASDLSQALGDRSVTADPKRRRLSRGLVVAEVAMSLALVTSTGLLLESLVGLGEVDLGFERDGVVTFALEATDWGSTVEESAAAMRAYLDGIRSVPGVQSAGFTNRIPLAGGLFTGSFRSEGMVANDAPKAEASIRYVTPDYLDTMGGRLVSGRVFEEDDGMNVVMIDEVAAERGWPGGNPVGQLVETSVIGEDDQRAEIIGVFAAMKHHGVREEAVETLFFPMLASANQQNFRYAAVRVAGEPESFVLPLREAVQQINANAVIARVRTMGELFDEDVGATRFATLLLTLFGGVALLLAVVGLHGVMAFSVRRRFREIGIRVVLGADHGRIVRQSVRAGAYLVVLGIVAGTGLSIVAGRLLGSLLFGVSPGDTTVLALSASLMLVVGLLGAYMPARLVLGVDPAVALREE